LTLLSTNERGNPNKRTRSVDGRCKREEGREGRERMRMRLRMEVEGKEREKREKRKRWPEMV
jgi:hypothetical protein